MNNAEAENENKDQQEEKKKDWKLGMSPYIDKTKSKKLNINFGEDMSSINQDVNVERASGTNGKNNESDDKIQIYKFDQQSLNEVKQISSPNEFEKSPKPGSSTLDEFNKEFSVFR